MKASSFNYLLKEGIKNAYINRLMSFASVGVLTACLVLVGSAVLFSSNVKSMVGYVEQQNEIVVFVEDNLSEEQEESLDIEIRSLDNAAEITYISKEQAFAEQQEKLGGLLEGYEDEGVFPASYRIKLKDIALMQSDVQTLEQLTGVYRVDAPTEVADILVNLEKVVTLFGTSIVIVLMVVALVIISNTIRLTVFSRRKEINIMKYVGATNGFIRLPFLVEGMVLGSLSSILSFVIIWYLYGQIYKSLAGSATAWFTSAMESVIPFKTFAVPLLFGFLGAGVLIGVAGSFISIRKHLKV